MNPTEARSARLLFAEELALGRVTPDALDRGEVVAAVRDRPVPSRVGRALQRRAIRRGTLTYAAASVKPMLAARRAVLGDDARGAPRPLLRVDGFPHARAWDDPERYGAARFRHVHDVLRAHEIPYLLSVLPHVPRAHDDPAQTEWRHLDGDELSTLSWLHADGVAFGLHGLDHRTTVADAAEHSELAGRSREDLIERLDRAGGALTQHGVLPEVFVAPFDRFDAAQYHVLAARFAVVTGGPGSVAQVGWHPTPLWRGDAVYMPSYRPLHGDARASAAAIGELAGHDAAVWVPVTLDWGRESDDALTELCRALRGLARPWGEFLAAVRATAAEPTTTHKGARHTCGWSRVCEDLGVLRSEDPPDEAKLPHRAMFGP